MTDTEDYYTLRKQCTKCGNMFEKLKRFYETGTWIDFELETEFVCVKCSSK